MRFHPIGGVPEATIDLSVVRGVGSSKAVRGSVGPYRVRLVNDALRRVELTEERRDVVVGTVVCWRELSLVRQTRHAVEGGRVEEPAVDRRRRSPQQIDGHDHQDGQSQDGEGGLQSFRLHGSGRRVLLTISCAQDICDGADVSATVFNMVADTRVYRLAFLRGPSILHSIHCPWFCRATSIFSRSCSSLLAGCPLSSASFVSAITLAMPHSLSRTSMSTCLEERRVFYAIRLPSNKVLQYEIAPLLIRPVGRPPKRPVILYDDFWYRAGSWDRARRVVAKVEWHQGELFPRVGFIVTNMTAGPEGVVRFFNGRGTAEQWIKEGKYALNWTRLSCHRFVANRVRLSLFVLAYNLGNFLRRLCLPKAVRHWSLRSVQVKLIKMGGRLVRHSRRLIFQLSEVSVPRRLFQGVLDRIGRLSPVPS